jgi:hypothetical protein
MFGSDDTDPDSSLVGRRKEIPLFSPSGGTIGHDQRRERHAHHLVSTPAVARPYISPVRVTNQATGSTLTGVVVSWLNRHAMGPSRKQLSPTRRSLGIPVSRCVQEFDAQVPACSAIAVPSRCTCIPLNAAW